MVSCRRKGREGQERREGKSLPGRPSCPACPAVSTGHSALSCASSRHSGGKGLLMGSRPDPGHGSAHLRAVLGSPGLPPRRTGRGVYCLDREEIDREHTSPVRSQELPPGHPTSRVGRSETRCPKPCAHRRRGGRHAKALQFDDDALTTPPSRARRRTSARISRRMGRRPTRPARVHRFATERRCQRSSVAGVTMSDAPTGGPQ